MIAHSPRSFGSGSPVRAYWLTRCQGFDVKCGTRVVGRVDDILCTDASGADALVVRGPRLRGRPGILPVERVVAVVPATSTLFVLDEEPAADRGAHVAAAAARVAVLTAALAARWARRAVVLSCRFALWSAPRLRRLSLRTLLSARRAAVWTCSSGPPGRRAA